MTAIEEVVARIERELDGKIALRVSIEAQLAECNGEIETLELVHGVVSDLAAADKPEAPFP